MKLTFYGAAQMVTGSCYLLETEKTRVLVDCGMIQTSHFCDKRNSDPFPFDPVTIDYVLITHAHIDHCGRIPKLVREGFKGKIISTAATLDLAELMMLDSANVLTSEAELHHYTPLYTIDDVALAKRLFHPVNYREAFTLQDLNIEFYDAGHILGSSFIRIAGAKTSIVFSGDLGNSPVPLLQETDPLPATDYIVMESTYGDTDHEPARERKLMLSSAIYETASLKGVLMIPAFSLERTQEILYELNSLVESKAIPELPIFLDSPLAIRATRLYPKYNTLFNAESQQRLMSGDDLFNFPGLTMTERVRDSKHIALVKAPKVIIAGSGMMQGGRIRQHLKLYLNDFRNQVLIIGYQVAGSLGRKLLDGEKIVTIDKKPYTVAAKIRPIGAYSAHADQTKLLHWLKSIKSQPPNHIWLTHGEPDKSQVLANAIHNTLSTKVDLPEYGQEVIL